MKKYTPPVPVIVSVWVLAALGIYGIKSWFLLGSHSLLFMALIAALSIPIALRMYRAVRHLYPTPARRRSACVLALLLVPTFLSMALGMGAPALVMRLLGPDTQISATVVSKSQGGRKCRWEMYIAEQPHEPRHRLCVSSSEYEIAEVRDRVVLNARRNALGTRIFSIEQAR